MRLKHSMWSITVGILLFVIEYFWHQSTAKRYCWIIYLKFYWQVIKNYIKTLKIVNFDLRNGRRLIRKINDNWKCFNFFYQFSNQKSCTNCWKKSMKLSRKFWKNQILILFFNFFVFFKHCKPFSPVKFLWQIFETVNCWRFKKILRHFVSIKTKLKISDS